jgi:hypothetical protein
MAMMAQTGVFKSPKVQNVGLRKALYSQATATLIQMSPYHPQAWAGKCPELPEALPTVSRSRSEK